MSPVAQQTTNEEEKRVFDISATLKGSILSGVKKSFEVRWPSDKEWGDRARKQKFIKRSIGRQKSEYDDAGSERADLELFESIRLDKEGPDWSAFEAKKVISKIERHDIESVDRSESSYRVVMTVHGIETVHEIRMPTLDQVAEYGRSAVKMYETGARRNTQTDFRQFIEPAGFLYDELLVDVSGYAGAVPIIHKATVISEIIERMEAEETDGDF